MTETVAARREFRLLAAAIAATPVVTFLFGPGPVQGLFAGFVLAIAAVARHRRLRACLGSADKRR